MPSDARSTAPLWKLLGVLFKPHPWHGIEPGGEDYPHSVNAYIEIVPTDTVKYEIDKVTGHLTIDRPQLYSNVCPTLYGFIPQTYCGGTVAARAHIEGLAGDRDPLDICVLTEKVITHGDILLDAVPIGGLRMIDKNESDDKIISVLRGDLSYGPITDISEVPDALVDRLQHYFLTYKNAPGVQTSSVEIHSVYGAAEAREVIAAAHEDYLAQFGTLDHLLSAALQASR